VADYELLLPCRLTRCPVTGALISSVPGHLPLADDAAMEIEAVETTLDAEGFAMVAGRGL
jgi:hypothetical protein